MINEMHVVTLKNCKFKVKPSDISAFTEIALLTDLPCLHLVLVDEAECMPWEELLNCGIRNGQLLDICDDAMEKIIKHYFGDRYTCADFAWRYTLNSTNAASVHNVHVHIYLAHKSLFGETGLIRRCVHSLLVDKSNT